MLILVLDPSGLNLDFCLRAYNDGHTIKWFTEGKKSEPIGQGLVDKVSNWKKYMEIADLIISCDNLKHMDEIDEYMPTENDVSCFATPELVNTMRSMSQPSNI